MKSSFIHRIASAKAQRRGSIYRAEPKTQILAKPASGRTAHQIAQGHGPHVLITSNKSSISTMVLPPDGATSAGQVEGGEGHAPQELMTVNISSIFTRPLPSMSA